MALLGCFASAPAMAQTGFTNGDTNYLSVFNMLQFNVPPPSSIVPPDNTGIISFKGIQPGSPEAAFVAAWEFCEHLDPRRPPGAHSSQSDPVSADVDQIFTQRDDLAIESIAYAACRKHLARRVAAPTSSQGALKSVGLNIDLSTIQQKLCLRLTNTISDANTPGMELQNLGNAQNGEGDQDVNTALANCQNGGGISEVMYNHVMARKCLNDNFHTKAMADALQGNTVMAEHMAQFECQAAIKANDQYEATMETQFLTAVQPLIEMRASVGPPMNPNSHPTQ